MFTNKSTKHYVHKQVYKALCLQTSLQSTMFTDNNPFFID